MESRHKHYPNVKHKPSAQAVRSQQLCSDCNKYRAYPVEFRVGLIETLNCINCHGKHGCKSRLVLKKAKGKTA